MSPAVARLLTRLYPPAWRERYGAEFEGFLLERGGSQWGVAANVLYSACKEHIFPTRGGNMDLKFGGMLKHPSAFLPVAMSLTALTLVVVSLVFGIERGQTDEGAVAHLWQLLMAGQAPLLLFFAVKWLPRAPRQTLYVLALQAGAALASIAPVFFFNL